MYILPVKFFVQLFVVYIGIVKNAASIPFGDTNQSESITDEGLYNTSDHVVILDSSNLKSTIYGSKNAWVVEFYNSWCGHCKRFAPLWKSLAREMKPWQDIIDVGAINCASDENNPVCREYEIMYYPMIKYFSPNSKLGALGVQIQQVKSAASIESYIIEQLQKDQQAGLGTTWPNITPYRSSESEDIWKGVPASVVYKFLLFEETDSFLGSEVILDFHNMTDILIRRVTSDNQMLCMNYRVTDFPNLFVIDHNGVRINLKLRTPTRLGVMEVINNFLKSKGLKTNTLNININDASSPSDKLEKNQRLDKIKVADDIVDEADLENAVRYSLEREISLTKIIDDLRLTALKEYLSVLAQYLPLKSGNFEYFNVVLNALQSSDSIKGEEFYKLIKSTEQNMSPVYLTNQQWVRCKGSNSQSRGYPCGLWTLFHTLTANYAASAKDTSLLAPAKILATMHSYVQYFFGCADCSDHFNTTAGELKLYSVQSADEAILWLWRAHNQVNERLAGDITEDPEFPKIQYPSKVHCSECRNRDNEWDLSQVLKYLKKKYTHSDFVYNNGSTPQILKFIKSDLIMNRNITHQQKTSWDFTIFDISICVALYVSSVVILILVCIKFLVKRTAKKKIQVHSLFLRV